MSTPGECTPAAYIPAPPIIYGPRDISGLRSGSQNPWGSLSHCCSYINPSHNHSLLNLSMSNSWRSSNHHSQWNPLSKLPPSYHSIPTPLHQFNSQFRSQYPMPPHNSFTPYSHSYSPHAEPPTNIFQFIRHPIGISETKPKIIKNIPAYPTPKPR